MAPLLHRAAIKTMLLTLSLGGATLRHRLDKYRVNGCAQIQTKNHADWFKYCEDVDNQT